MRIAISWCMAAWVVLAFPAALLGGTSLARADRLFSSGTPSGVRESAVLYGELSDRSPTSYEAAWKASRAFRQCCLDCPRPPGGEPGASCRELGRMGMKYGQRAMGLEPGRVEGNYWYGCSVACLARGESTLNILRQGLKDKARTAFEHAYAIDRRYDDGGPVKALGRYWYVLPWPFGDRGKALAYLREYQRLYPNDPEGQVYLAELLMDLGNKAEARALLRRAASSGEPYFSRRAAAMLAGS
jgi:tetratricopeptide (TPR) repeat protein